MPRAAFTNPRMGWRESEHLWVIQADHDPPMQLADLKRPLPGNPSTTLLDYLVVFQEAYMRAMPEGSEKARRRRAIAALRAGQVRIEPRRGPANRAWALTDGLGRAL